MGWLQDLFSKTKDKIKDTGAYEYLTAPARYRERSEEGLEGMQSAYDTYTLAAEELLSKPPQIDLSGFMDSLGGYEEQMLDEYMRSAGQIEGAAGKGLKSAMSGYDAFLNMYKDLARQDMPGMDIYRGQIGSQATDTIQGLKDIGGLTRSGVAGAAAQQNQSLRDLALQSGMYRSQRQQDLASAYGQHGQMAQGAYNAYGGALQSAAGLRGQGISGAAGLAGQQAALQQTQFQYNQLLPWQTGMQYNQAMAMANNPYQAQMQYNAEMMAYSQAQQQAALQGVSNAVGNVWGMAQEGMSQLATAGMGGGLEQMIPQGDNNFWSNFK